MYKTFKIWVLLAFVTAAMCGLVYLAIQQNLRQSANDPQIQMAEDAAAMLARDPNLDARGLFPITPMPTDIGTSLSPYMVIFNSSGIPWIGNGEFNNVLPRLPAGVFNVARANGEVRFTWQPERGVRQAVVLVAVGNTTNSANGFVMASRSLREVEIREDNLLYETAATWFATVVGIFILLSLFELCESRHTSRRKK